MPFQRVFLDTGHGLNNAARDSYDPGARTPFGQEHEIVTRIAGGVCAAMEHEGVQEIPDTLSLGDVIAWVNERAWKDDLALALHMNAGGSSASGTEVFFAANAPPERQYQAHVLGTAVATILRIPFRGSKPDTDSERKTLGFLRQTDCPALLLEIGFLTNKDDVKAVRARGVSAVCDGIRALRRLGGVDD